MTSAINSHGGQEATILSLYTTMKHLGAIIVALGYTDDSTYVAGGNPYGTSVTVDQEGEMVEDADEAVKYRTRKTIQVAKWIKDGINNNI